MTLSWSKYPLMSRNPYALLRERAGYTQKRFCEEFKFAKQTVIGIESGMYPELSERMHDAINMACDKTGTPAWDILTEEYDTPYLNKAYAAWQKHSRQEVTLPPVEIRFTSEFSPMHFFVKDTIGSVQGFAKKLKVPPAMILRYIRGEQRLMPLSLWNALKDVGYADKNTLQNQQAEWTDKHGRL